MVFADTFYWIALTLPGDAAYARAQQITDDIVTTEEVTEYRKRPRITGTEWANRSVKAPERGFGQRNPEPPDIGSSP